MTKLFVRAVIERDGKFLVMREAKRPGRWNFPGGAKDPGDEDLRHALRRELEEEIGVEVKSASLIRWMRMRVEDISWLGYFYRVGVVGEPSIQEPDKCLEMKWVTREELGQLPCREGALDLE